MTTTIEADLDDLYWNTTLPVAAIADRCGVPAGGLHLRVTPLDAGTGVLPLRHAPLVHEPQHPRRGSSPVSPLRLLAPRPDSSAVRTAGRAATRAPGGARRRGRRPRRRARHRPHRSTPAPRRSPMSASRGPASWSRVTDVGLVAAAVVRALGALTPGVVAVPTLGALGTSQARAAAGALHAHPPRMARGLGRRRRARLPRPAAANLGPRRHRRRTGRRRRARLRVTAVARDGGPATAMGEVVSGRRSDRGRCPARPSAAGQIGWAVTTTLLL